MSKKKIAGIIVGCIIAIIVVIVITNPGESTPPVETYTLTTIVSPSGAGSVSPSGGEYESGVQVTVTASPDSGFTFSHWSGNVSSIADINAAATNINMNGDYSITANFESIPAGQYSLTIASTAGGSVTVPGEGAFTYDAGTVVSLAATPASGYQFVNWSGNVGTIANVNAASTTITMNGDYSITANFESIPAGQYSLTIASTAGGSVTVPGEGTFTCDEGTVVSLVATPASGYQFVNWTGDVGTISDVNDATTTITMNGDYSITANFLGGIEIWDWYDLDATREDLDGYYFLMNDLDSTTAGYEELASPTANGGNGWQPIGSFTDSFTGTFDGQGYEIRDLFINRPDKYSVGLFDWVGQDGVIKDIGVVNAIVTGYDNVGGLVGWSYGIVSNSYSTGSVTGTVSTHEPGDFDGVGGVVGINAGNVSHCYSTGSVTGYEAVGGLVGYSYGGTVSYSYSTSSVTGNSSGGLVGWNREGTVSNSHSTGTVTGDAVVGGLVGFNLAGTVSDSYSTSSVTGNSSGGLVGFNAGIVSNSHSTGTVTGDAVVGGLVGGNTGPVDNSYSTGSVTGSEYVGGLVAWNDGIVSNSFWDTETSGQSTSDGGTGKTTLQMKDITTFSAYWDIVAVSDIGERDPAHTWNIVDDETYPFLSWQL